MLEVVDIPAPPASPAAPSAPIHITLESDLDAAGRYGHETLEVTATSVRVLAATGAVINDHPIDSLASARHEPLVGGGRLELTTKSRNTFPIISYTTALADKFSEAARGIEQLAKGEPFLIQLKHEKTHCAKCHRRLPERDGKCPACVSRWKMLGRIAAFLKPYKIRVAILVTTTLLSASLNLVPPWIQRNIVDRVLLKHDEGLTLLFKLVGTWVGILALLACFQIITGRLVAYLSAHVIADIRAAVYRAIELLQMSFFEKKKVGAIQSRLTNDTQNIWGFLVDGVPFLLSNLLLFTGSLTLLFLTNWVLALAILSPILLVFVLSATLWGRLISKYIRWSHKWSKFQSHLTEALTGVKVMKAFAQEEQEAQRFVKHNDGLRHSGAEADQYWYTIFGAMTFFTALAMVVHFAVGGTMVYRGKLTPGQFWMVQQYLFLILGPMQWFAAVNNWFSRAMAGTERIFEIMDTTPEKYTLPSATAHPITGDVEFCRVRFGYDKSNPVIRDLSFHARPGEMIGLVGKSGSGKSTTISLLCRFYEPDAGSVKIDGIDYRDLALQDMRSQIGVVLQEPFLFNGSIAENIAYGKPGASFDEILTAARAANAHAFILEKPDAYDTIVGERGSKLSGGERQRISIARAILHNPRILILDEATSSVDVETEKQIQAAIATLIKGRTTFAIAHRLSTLRNASRLIVLDKGHIVELGTHAELMEKKGTFYKLVQTQTAANEIIGVGNA